MLLFFVFWLWFRYPQGIQITPEFRYNYYVTIGYGALLSLMAAVIVGAVTIVYNLVARRLDDVM